MGLPIVNSSLLTAGAPLAQPPDDLEGLGHPKCVTPTKQSDTSAPTAFQGLSRLSGHLIGRKLDNITPVGLGEVT